MHLPLKLKSLIVFLYILFPLIVPMLVLLLVVPFPFCFHHHLCEQFEFTWWEGEREYLLGIHAAALTHYFRIFGNKTNFLFYYSNNKSSVTNKYDIKNSHRHTHTQKQTSKRSLTFIYIHTIKYKQKIWRLTHKIFYCFHHKFYIIADIFRFPTDSSSGFNQSLAFSDLTCSY